MARRQKRYEEDNHDRWLISYADFITLLFAFFVVMYAVSSINVPKYKTFSHSLSLALSNKPNSTPDSIIPEAPSVPTSAEQEKLFKVWVDRRTARLGEQQRKILDRMKNVAGGLSGVMSPLISQRLVNVKFAKRGVVLDISASALFKTGEAELQPSSFEVLRAVAVVLGAEELPIEVEGHTDDVPIMTAQFPSNWELSSARASSVARMLIDNGVPAKRLSVVGLASNQPLVPNDSPESRARNRRVSLTIVSPDAERVLISE